MTIKADFSTAQINTVVDILKDEMNDDAIVAIYNLYAESNNYSRIFPMGELDDMVSPTKSVSETLRRFDEDFNLNHDYFVGGYKIASGEGRELVEDEVDYKTLAEYLIEEGDPEDFLEKHEDQLRESFIKASKKSVANELFEEWEEWLNDNLYDPELRDNEWVDLFDSLWDSFEEFLWAKDANE